MEQTAPTTRRLARILLALEAAQSEGAQEDMSIALNAIEKLRVYLSKLVGIAGFQALLARALALAKTEADWLEAVSVQSNSTLEGFREAALQQSPEAVTQASTAILTQLLGLLVTFVGESLTLRLVREVWPEAQGEDYDLDTEETPA